MADDFDLAALLQAQSGDTSGDKPLRTPVMESNQRYIYHSDEKSRTDSADKKQDKKER